MFGYRHPLYVESMRAFGMPRHLPHSNGWILVRQLQDSSAKDGMGCYPLFFCDHWSHLREDLHDLRDDLVTVSLVADPFAQVGPDQLARDFDRVLHFKDHFVVDLSLPLEATVRASHRANVRKAMRSVEVRACEHPLDRLDTWAALFSVLARRHGITGVKAFSPEAFATQFSIPGFVMFEALAGDEVVGLDLWFLDGEVAYGHLVALSERGYQLRASYATKWFMLRYFADKARWVDLGGTAGLAGNDDGLAAFKSGWATGTRPVYFCGKVLQPEKYQALVAAAGTASSTYFPAYRSGEFA